MIPDHYIDKAARAMHADDLLEGEHEKFEDSPPWYQAIAERRARAERAEKELDEAIRRMNDHSTNARGWMQTSEEWQATAEEWERRAHAAEQPHPLTADDITDSHVLSARLKANALGWFRRFDAPNEEWRQVLTAALTEPPRPEGAEDVAVALFQAGAAAGVEMTPKEWAALADHLAAMEYRKDATR